MSKNKYDISKYKEKHDVKSSVEPTGKKDTSKSQGRFSFQKHDAQNLHYDFRLELDGVLKSWSIPKGPSTDTRDKRLALRTEDHPLDYIHFEGIIPEGNYGAGTVLLWDKGTYDNMSKKDDEQSLKEAFSDGHFSIYLHGEKIKGGYAMTRINDKDEQWLLVKMDDEEADARRKPVNTETKSVKSGKDLSEME